MSRKHYRAIADAIRGLPLHMQAEVCEAMVRALARNPGFAANRFRDYVFAPPALPRPAHTRSAA